MRGPDLRASAGTSKLGVELTQVTEGWSVKKAFLGKPIYNEEKKKVGNVEDVILSTDGTASYLVIGAGGFVGIGKHDVVIPVQQVVLVDQKFVLPGATKQALKDLPKFKYVK